MLESRNEIIKCKFDITFFYLIEDILIENEDILILNILGS